jgi:hypothetical protein
MSDVVSRAIIALLIVFHAVLLLWHALDGRLLEPATSLRWIVAVLLFGGFLALRRLGAPLFWGRKAVVLWLLVALLHGQAALSEAPAAGLWSRAGTFAAEVFTATVAAVSLWLVVFAVRARTRIVRQTAGVLVTSPERAPGCCRYSFPFFPRPPPVLSAC